MTKFPAKPTIYNGTRFRSRLEAKWAVFFDSIYESWIYEPETPETTGRYQADFLIPARRALIEIKPLIPGESEPVSIVDDSWTDRLELFREACTRDRQGYIIFGAPGEWGNGRLISPGHSAFHLYFNGSIDFHFDYRFGECPRCANVWLFRDGFADCCPVWDRGDTIDAALNAVRDHSFEDGA